MGTVVGGGAAVVEVGVVGAVVAGTAVVVGAVLVVVVETFASEATDVVVVARGGAVAVVARAATAVVVVLGAVTGVVVVAGASTAVVVVARAATEVVVAGASTANGTPAMLARRVTPIRPSAAMPSNRTTQATRGRRGGGAISSPTGCGTCAPTGIPPAWSTSHQRPFVSLIPVSPVVGCPRWDLRANDRQHPAPPTRPT